MRVTLALPTVEPVEPLGVDRDLYDSCMGDLVAASGALKAHDKALCGAVFSISHSDQGDQHPLVRDKWKLRKSENEFGLLVISADLDDFAREIRGELLANEQINESDVSSMIESLGVHNLTFEVNNLLLLANVLHPGALSATAGFVFVNNVYVGEAPAFFAGNWDQAIYAAQKFGWPTFQTLRITQAWPWLASTRCIDDGVGRNSVGRALAALSYAAPGSWESESSLDLAWALLGLEALYCVGHVGLREQLVAKTELVLGPRIENKKAFGTMYDFRSRLIHGDMDLPLRYSGFDAVPDVERHYDHLSDFQGLALVALLATLQAMIKNDWSSLTFHYGFNGIPALAAV
ncbi:MAG: hypothetical protein ACYC39_09555 [Thiobacillus sp.]